MLVTEIVLFALCHGPSLIDNVLVSFGYVERLNYGNLKHMRQAFALLSYFNSCLNPIVYAFMSRNFRNSFKLALCMCMRRAGSRRAYDGYSPASNCDMNTPMRMRSLASQSPHTSDGGIDVGGRGMTSGSVTPVGS